MQFPFFKRNLDRSFIPVRSPEGILSQNRNREAIAAIQRNVGLSDNLFNKLYYYSLLQTADLVQSCPASESHHHAYPGGLIAHILESCANALRFRKNRILPVGASPEVASKKSDLYTYAVFAATLLHDVAKPLTDQIVTVHDKKGRKLYDWNPVYKTISSDRNAGYITISFRPGRNYTHHQNSALIYLNRILLEDGCRWIQEDTGVYSEFLAVFAENPSGPIHELMTKGDQLSVARALGARNVSQFASGRPLWMKIKTAARALVDSGELSLNRPGASGWVTDRGLWLLSKRGVDAIRDQLAKEGHGGVPTDNRRIFDVMAEGGLLVLNDSQKAIWRCRVQSGDWKPETTFTLLRFPLDVIWDDPDAIPYFEGTVLESDGSEDDAKDEAPSAHHSPAPSHITPLLRGSHNPQSGWGGGTTVADPTPQTSLVSLFFGEADAQENEPEPISKQDGPGPGNGRRFLEWIEAGINKGSLEINTRKAVIHVLEQGLFVVSPLGFKRCAQDLNIDWQAVQNAFRDLRINLKNHKDENWFRVRVEGKKMALLTGWIIPWERLSLEKDVQVNERLTLVLQDMDQTD